MDSIHVIFNPAAGQGRFSGVLPAVRAHLTGKREVRWLHTARPRDASRFAADAVRAGVTTIVAVGGDGTLNEIVNGLMRVGGRPSLPRLAVIPTGSSNDFAQELGIPNVRTAFERLFDGASRAVDIGEVVDEAGGRHYFCVTAGIGFLAIVARERYRVRRVRGRLLYLVAALRALRQRPRPLRLTLSFDGAPPEQHRLTTLSVNNCFTVGGYLLNPEADMRDGHLDSLLVRPVSPLRLVRLILDARTGAHVGQKEVSLRRFSRLQVVAARPMPLHLDGQVALGSASDARSLQIRVRPKALTVIA